MIGLIAFQSGQFDLAIQALNQATQLQPENAHFLANFTEILRSAKHLERAIEIGERAVLLAPDNAAAHSNLGLVYYDLGKLDLARASQEQALALVPDFDRALNNLGSIALDTGDGEKATQLYRQALRINPHSSETANNLVSVLIELANIDEAEECCKSLLEHFPRDAELHRNLGRILSLRNQLDKAEAAFRRAITLNGNKAENHVGLSQVLLEKNHPKLALIEAEQAFQIDSESAVACHQVALVKAHLGDIKSATALYLRAIKLKPEFTASRLALGYLAMEQGSFDSARQHFEAAMHASDDKLNAQIALSQLEEITEETPVFRALKAELPNAASMLPQKATAFHYAIGQCYEKLGKYDDAFENFARGAEIKRSLVRYDAAETDHQTDKLISTFDSGLIKRLRRCAITDATPVFIVGMPRSGTTLTESILNAHPEVVGAGELNDLQNLFGKTEDNTQGVSHTVQSASDETLTHLAREYINALRTHAFGTPHIVDKMPVNFQLIGLIHGILPNAKIIHIARDPLDTCLSCYTRLFERSQLHSYDQVELGRYFNNYIRLMNHWDASLPKGAFHSIHYEHLIDDIETVARGIIEYCGLQWDESCLNFYSAQRRVRTASLQQVRQPLYKSSKAKWRRYEKHLQPLIDTIGSNRITF